jgi:hypothetical protein
MINVNASGSFNKTEKFLKKIKSNEIFSSLDRLGQKGVDALSSASPVETGLLSTSWDYYIINKVGKKGIVWTNTNVENNIPVAILVQYGHATKDGGLVEGLDYINPAIQPIFDEIATTVWREVNRA